MLAACRDSTDLMQLLLDFKADLEAKNSKGFTVVDYAIIYGAYQCLLFLRKKGLAVLKNFKDISRI